MSSSSAKLLDAAIKVAEKIQSNKAVLVIAKPSPEKLSVQFNPSEYKITERTNYTEKERRENDEPVVNFSGRPLATLNVRLYFDSDELTSIAGLAEGALNALMGEDPPEKNIAKTISKITALTIIDGETHAPTGVVFVWGTLLFAGYAENVGVNYTMFDNNGKPIRAIVDLTIKGYSRVLSEKKSPRQSPDRTKARIMTEDVNIWSMAQNEYGDVREWRRIADANGIMNPLDIPVGKVLKVPSITTR
ncbi:MAG: hypothetical protein IJU82_03570 [Ruminiclostridium sp.]|jgi:hypothetical protein|nr:hypothetical protein [Ruminiclostridium sp.]